MNATVYIVSIIGLVSSVFTTTVNFLLIRWTMKQHNKINHEFTLFFYRFILDLLLGSTLGIYLGLVVVYLLFPDHLESIQSHVELLGLPSSNAAAARAIVAMLISIERNLATFTPLFYHKMRRRYFYNLIFIVAIAFGLFEDVVMFIICDYSSHVIPPSCVAFGCATSSCFKNYWMYWKMVVFTVTFLFSVSLCCKLLYWRHCSGKQTMAIISRINRLALIDATTVLLFDFLPSFCANLWPTALIFSFEYVGPYNAVCKLFGSAIDAVLAYQLIARSSPESPRNQSSSLRTNKIGTNNNADWVS